MNKKYIYNLQQAYFYIANGVLPIEPPRVHYKTRKVFFTFDFNETKDVYSMWCKC